MIDNSGRAREILGTDKKTLVSIDIQPDIKLEPASGPDYITTQSDLSNVAVAGGTQNAPIIGDNTVTPILGVSFVGNQTAGSYSSLKASTGHHIITDDAGEIDIIYVGYVGTTGKVSGLTWVGYVNSQTDSINIDVWDFIDLAWIPMGTLPGKNQATDDPKTITLFTSMTGTGVDIGKVYIRANNTGGSGSFQLASNQLYVSYATVGSVIGYANGSIWIDTVLGESGIIKDVNGVADKKSNNLPDAITLSGPSIVNLKKFEVSQGSVLTFVETMDGYSFQGLDYIIDLGSQQVDGTTIGGAVVSGEAVGNGGSLLFISCKFGDVTLPEVAIIDGVFVGTITANEPGLYFTKDCASAVAGAASTPIFDFASLGSVALNMRNYSGGIEIRNMTAGDTMSLEGDGQYIIHPSCLGGEIAVRGSFKKTDNSGLVTINDDANSYSPVIHAGKAQGGGENFIILSQTASPVNKAYDPCVVNVTSGPGDGQSRRGFQYEGATRKLWISKSWGPEPDATSDYEIIADAGGTHVNEGTLQGPGATGDKVILNIDASSVDDIYKDQTIFFWSGPNEDEAANVIAYNGTTKEATLDRILKTAVTSSTVYAMHPWSIGPAPSAVGAAAALAAYSTQGVGDEATNQQILIEIQNITGGGALNPITIHVEDFANPGTPVSALALEIWDLSETVRWRAGTTDTNGDYDTGGLVAGDYTIMGSSAAWDFTKQPITIDPGGGTINLTAVSKTISPIPAPGLTTLYGYTSDIVGVPVENLAVQILTQAPVAVFDGASAIDGSTVIVYTDANGLFSVGVVKGVPVRIQAEGAKYNRTITFADEDVSMDWKDIPEVNNNGYSSY